MTFESWGRYPFTDQQGDYLASRHQALPQHDTSFLPYGNGRSYGDSCLNEHALVLSTRYLNRFISFDAESGVLRCESGVLLKSILETFVPQGWFLPVVPGTQYVTVGGAIANDVHGKNHHVHGTFGHFVVAFELLRSDGQRLRCSATENTDYFYATIAGLGLTGVVTWADIQLKPVTSSMMLQETTKYHSLDEFFALSASSESTHEYSVAWLDCLASGKQLGRGHFTRANHVDGAQFDITPPKRMLSVPFSPPISPVNKVTLKLFNSLYFHRQRAVTRQSKVHYESFFFPLDGVKNWNRMYGKKGFLQYQCVIPPEFAQDGIRDILRCISKAQAGSFLAVLKVFGNKPSLGLLSYPAEGANLALDFPYQGDRTLRLFDALNEIVLQTGGRIYPAKDAHMDAQAFQTFYPQWGAVEALRDPNISSSFWRRVTGLEDDGAVHLKT